MATTTTPTPEKLTAKERIALLEGAKADHAAVKVAKAAGRPLPKTPSLDELQRRHEEMTSTRATVTKTTTGNGGGAGRTKHDDGSLRKLVADAIVAGHVTAGAVAKHLRATGNGSNDRRVRAAFDDVVGGKVDGLDMEPIKKALKGGAPAKATNATAKAAPAKPSAATPTKKAPAKKAPAKKAAAKRDGTTKVTPLPKKSTK